MTTALITGASSGIGKACAFILAKRGHDLIITGRDKEALRKVADEISKTYHVKVEALAADLAKPAATKEICAFAQERHVEILVNNAGFGVYGKAAETPAGHDDDLIAVNVRALVYLTKFFARDMAHHGGGHILNVASTAAFVPGPLMASYYASKSFVLSYSRALQRELRGSGVTITVLCPGPTTTGFQRRAGIQKIPLVSMGMMDAHVVALAGINGMMEGRAMVIPGVRNKLIAFFSRFLPASLAAKIVEGLQERRA